MVSMMTYDKGARSSSKDSGQRNDKPIPGPQVQGTACKGNRKAVVPNPILKFVWRKTTSFRITWRVKMQIARPL